MKQIIKSYNVSFLGRTGNGKSSLINAMFGSTLSTDPLVPCTKILSTTTMLSKDVARHNAVTAFDTPGIGEFSSAVPYQLYYEHAVSQSNCIVLVTTLDRTDAPAQRLLVSLKQFINARKHPKFVIALNHIDSKVTIGSAEDIVWDDEKNEPTKMRLEQIKERMNEINKKYGDKFLPFEIVPVCAKRNYGITELKSKILK
ncbi:MAG: GTPase domain-containing protein [Bacteroidales bacterium]|nr:GTPase domain-containing protein [Bacteroidales bacterium]